MKRPQSNSPANTLLIVFGIAIATIGIVLRYALPDRYGKIDVLPIIVGGAMAYFGALWKDPNRAKRAGDGVTHVAGDLVHSYTELRTGNRKTDPVVRIDTTASVDTPAPDEPPTGGFPPREGQ